MDLLYGDEGGDVISSSGTAFGGAGGDFISASGSATVFGGARNDSIRLSSHTA